MATRPAREKLGTEVNYWNILLAADSGAGKTVFGGTDNGVLFISTEDAGRNSGTISAARMGSTAEKIDVHSYKDVINAYEYWDDNPDDLKDVKVLVIDSLPEMQRLAKEYVLEETAPEKIRKGRDPKKMELNDYGLMHEIVENMVRGFNDLSVNVLYTATAKKVEDADKVEFLAPDIQGKGDYGFAMKIVSLMTSYGFMRVEQHDVPAPTEDNPQAMKKVKRRVFYWEDTGTIRGKDRTCTLTPFTINMTLQQMRLAIAGKMKRNAEGKIVKLTAPDAPAPKAVAKQPAKTPVPQPSPEPSDNVESKNGQGDGKDAGDGAESSSGAESSGSSATPTETKGEAVELDLDSVEA